MTPACVCGGALTVWLDWPQVPLANALRRPDDPPAPRHDLTLGRCHACGTSALMTPLPPTTIFQRATYPYRSGITPSFRTHAAELAKAVDALAPTGPILDVGGNDGTVREAFRAYARDAAVVDPCTPEADFGGFFPEATRHRSGNSYAAITALNVFAHVPSPQVFADEVARLLKPDGVFVLEVLWLKAVLEAGALDTLYHEHWWHWTLEGLRRVLRRSGLSIIAAEHLPIQGGTIRVWAQPGRANTAPDWDEAALLTSHPYRVAVDRWEARIARLKATLAEGRWAGFAATAKATMLAYAAGLGPKQLAYVVDDGPVKQGRLTPYDVPIVPRTQWAVDPVDGVMLFAPALATELQTQLLAAGFRGRVAVA